MLLTVNKKNYIKYLGRRTVHLTPILWGDKSVIIVLYQCWPFDRNNCLFVIRGGLLVYTFDVDFWFLNKDNV